MNNDLFEKFVKGIISESTYNRKLLRLNLAVGVRVVAIRNVGNKDHTKGYLGTILDLGRDNVLVEFDENIAGHNGNSGTITGQDGHCWWCEHRDIKIAHVERGQS